LPLKEVGRPWAVFLAVALMSLVAAPAAHGHARLLQTEPARDSIAEESPAEVVLHFDEPVETALGAVRVYDGRGERVDADEIARPSGDAVATPIDDRLPRGTYTVAWHVISADSDPISGAFVFHVEQPGPQPAGIAAEVLEDTPPHISVLYTTGRGIDYALLLLCVGGTAALALALGSAGEAVRRRLLRVLALLALALVAVALVGVVLQAAAAGRLSLGDAARWDSISSVLDTRYGHYSLLRAGLALVLALVALRLARLPAPGGRPEWAVAALAAVGLVVTPVASGHASVSGTIPFIADLCHVQAAAVWTGGLGFVVLSLALAGKERWPLAARVVPRFSIMALASVAVLLIGGAINGIHQVGAWRGLWETTYGRLLLAKIALILPLLGLGAYNNRYAVPRLRAGIASLIERRRFLRAARAELAIMLSIVGVTAVLVNASPARDEVLHEVAAHEFELGPLDAHLTVEPAMVGRNQLHLDLQGHEGEPAHLAEVRMSASLASREIGPLALETRPGPRPGEYLAQANLPIAGDWEVRVEARRGEFDLFTETASIEVGEE
jgi:copper transport protein